MRRVVITGMGIVSSIGNDVEAVTKSLKESRSGISFAPDYAEHGFRSQIHGKPDLDPSEHVDKRQMRFMGDGAAFNYIAMEQAIADAGLEPGDVSNERTGLIMGSGGPSTRNLFEAHRIVIEKGSPKRMGPFMVTRGMSSTNSATASRRRSGSRASTTRSPRPARPARIASATASSRSSGASRTSSSPAAARSWTGRCPACSTRWAR